MKFESITIKNFRNFKDIQMNLDNKNVFFGLNDVGKTNFLYALRYIFDKDIRKLNLSDSDYHNKNVSEPIEITVEINISDEKCEDNQKLRAHLKGAIMSSDEKIYIKLKAIYDRKELIGQPILYWGGDLENLQEMKMHGYLYEVDYVFNVFYIDAYVDMYTLFKKNINTLVKNEDEQDNDVLEKIQTSISNLNSEISTLSGIKKFEDKITPEYKKFRNDAIEITVKSEIAVKGLYSNLIPYIKQENTTNLYPTSGEGRKKLLSYSIFDIIADDTAERKINLFLVEEPENHLHKSMQIALSQILFTDEKYKYLFVTTHSPFILYEMDKVNLVRIYNENQINSSSIFYKVPKEYEQYKKILNRRLSEAIFANKVLLVEGPSELVLFEKVLFTLQPFYESEGISIIDTGGIKFKKYIEILQPLHIQVIVKTDNDLRSNNHGGYSVLGFSRCNGIIGKEILPITPIQGKNIEDKRTLYTQNAQELNNIRKDYNIFLSKVDLENDLDEVLHEKMVQYLNTENVVEYLQQSKLYNMVELIEKLTYEDCMKIKEHYNFECLKEVLK